MLELVRSTKEIKLDDKTYSLKVLTKSQALKHQDLVNKAEGDTAKMLEIFSNLLNDLGLPLEIVETLEIEHFKSIADYLFGEGKK